MRFIYYSDIPFTVFLVWMAISLILGKNIDLMTIEIASLPLRHTQSFMIILFFMTIPLGRNFRFPANQAYGLFFSYGMFFALGLFEILRSYADGVELRFIFANAGIFYYAVFFYLAFTLINSYSKFILFIRVLFYAWFIGVIVFILGYAIENDYKIPFGIHLSSDLLPMMSGSLVMIYIAISRLMPEIRFLRYIAYLAPFFMVIVLTKGVILATILAIFVFLYKKHHLHKEKIDYLSVMGRLDGRLITLLGIFAILSLMVFNLNSLESFVQTFPISDGNKFNILYRIYMWKDVSSQIISGGVLGHGFIPFNSETVAQKFVNMQVESEGVNPHNSYLMLTYFTGWVGLTIFLVFMRFIYKIVKIQKNSYQLNNVALGIYLSGGVFLFAALTTPVLEIYYLAPFLWVFLGAACRFALSGHLWSIGINPQLSRKL